MTNEEAARILDPETSREALAEIKYYGGFCGMDAVIEAANEAFRIAAEVLRQTPPAHIDREAWTAEWKEYTGADAGFHYCSKCRQQAFNYEESGEVVEVFSDFCPGCGRAMTPEAWAELEKRMRGGV